MASVNVPSGRLGYEQLYSGVVWHNGRAVGIRPDGFLPPEWFKRKSK